MSIDLDKLSPAPWAYSERCGAIEIFVGPTEDDIAYSDADGKFIVDARAAFDVMMRRRWVPVWIAMNGDWTVFDEDGMPMGDYARAADPFTALVEADHWYRQNVEKDS